MFLASSCTGIMLQNVGHDSHGDPVLEHCDNGMYVYPALDLAAGAALVAASLYWLHYADRHPSTGCGGDGRSDCNAQDASLLLAFGPPTFAITAAMGFYEVHACRVRDAEVARQRREQEAKQEEERRRIAREQAEKLQRETRARAIALAKTAAAAARGDDCARVLEIDRELRALDLDFHDSVFVRDVAIARCLARHD